MIQKTFLLIASLSGTIAVSLGAFGAHALKDRLSSNGYLETYQTAVSYQFYHTLALLAIAIIMKWVESSWLNYAGYAMSMGILVFSGSLYILCFTGIKWLGAITPIGGLAFIIGWFCLFMTALKAL